VKNGTREDKKKYGHISVMQLRKCNRTVDGLVHEKKSKILFE